MSATLFEQAAREYRAATIINQLVHDRSSTIVDGHGEDIACQVMAHAAEKETEAAEYFAMIALNYYSDNCAND